MTGGRSQQNLQRWGRIIKKYYKQIYVTLFCNLGEMEEFFERQKLLELPEKIEI